LSVLLSQVGQLDNGSNGGRLMLLMRMI